ncbi:MAG TPA: plastocyanin/azurin family copper-binding protein [Acidimicrobiia bacterium]|nr:plastocyanin/azurin family copper-binding protein [Acidimicrobiia bacterium]
MSGLSWRVGATLMLVAAVFDPLGPAPAGAATPRVVLANMHFTPPRLEVALGDSVIWEAADEGHTVTARDGSFDSSPRGLMADGDEFRFRFRVPGTYAYFCRVHQNRGMAGEIVVIDPASPASPSTTSSTTAPAATSAAAPAPATTAPTVAPTTTTSRPLATSSTTSLSIATATTTPLGTETAPHEPPTMNPNARVVGSPAPGQPLGETESAAATSRSGGGPGSAVAIGALGALGVGGLGGLLMVRRRRRAHAGQRHPL